MPVSLVGGEMPATPASSAQGITRSPNSSRRINRGGLNVILGIVAALTGSAINPEEKVTIDGSGEDVIIRSVTTATDLYFVGVSSSPDLPVTDSTAYGGDGSSTVVGDIVVGRVSLSTGATVWLTYLGGSASDFGNGIDIDPSGILTISGWTTSTDFPVTTNAQQSSSGGLSDAVIAQFDSATGALTYASYLGGSGDDQFADVAYLPLFERWAFGGFSSSQDFPFPATNGASVTTSKSNNDTEGLFVGMSNDGTQTIELAGLHRRLSGHQTIIRAVAAGPGTDGFYIAGTTTETSFWDTGFGAEGEGLEMFVNRINTTTGARRYNKTLGGTGDDTPLDIGFINASNVVIVGTTTSTDYPTTSGLLQPTFGGGTTDGFLHQLNPTSATSDGIATYFGGNGDDAIHAIAKDANVFAPFHLAGVTSSSDLPTADPSSSLYVAPGQESNAGGPSDGFVALMRTGLQASDYYRFTYVGGPGEDGLTTVANDLSYTPTSSFDPYLPFAAGTTNNSTAGATIPATSSAPAAGPTLQAVGTSSTQQEAFKGFGFTLGDPSGGADMEVSIPAFSSDPAEKISFGVPFDVVFHVQNNGPDDATSVRFNNEFSDRFNVIATSLTGDVAGTITISNNTIRHLVDVSFPEFPAGGSADLHVTIILIRPVEIALQVLPFFSEVSALSNDPGPSANNANINRLAEILDSDIGVALTFSETAPFFGDTVDFELVITNHGPENATGIVTSLAVGVSTFPTTIFDLLPGGVTVSPVGQTGHTITIDVLPFLESRRITGSIPVNFDAPLPFLASYIDSSIIDTSNENNAVGVSLAPDLLNVGRISGSVFQDNNGNGIKDGDDPPFENVGIQFLDAVTKQLLSSTVTLTDGTFISSYLPSGLSVEVQIMPPTGHAHSFTPPLVVEIPSGNVVALGAKGLITLASTDTAVAGFVFLDLNLNGTLDPGEAAPAPSGFSIFVDQNGNGNFDGGEPSTLIDENGFYRFDSLSPGTQNIRTQLPPLYIQTGPGATPSDLNPTRIVEGIAGEQSSEVNFAVIIPIDLSLAFVIGSPDIPRGGLANISINISNHSAVAVNSVIASLGPDVGPLRYVFRNPSTDPGYFFSADNSRFATIDIGNLGAGETVTLTAQIEALDEGEVEISGVIGSTHGDNNLENNSDSGSFIVSPPNGELAGAIFDDQNGNGIRDPGEPGVGGREVVVTDSEGIEHTATTNPDGSYVIGSLPNGETTVSVTPEANTPATTGTTSTVTVTSGSSTPVDDVGLALNASGKGGITGIVFDDLNSNGVRDNGEPTINGITVHLAVDPNTDPRTTPLPSNITRNDGRFTFSNLDPGVYHLRLVPTGNRIQTTPQSPTITSLPDLPPANPVSVQADIFVTANDFGLAEFNSGSYSFDFNWFHVAPPAPEYTLKPVRTHNDEPYTYDGNGSHLVVTGTNNSDTSIRFTATLVEATGGDLPSGLSRISGSATMNAHSSGVVIFEWDTDGHAWIGIDPAQVYLFRVELSIENTEFSSMLDAPLHVRPRPVVAVHGLWSDAVSWEDYPAFLASIRDDWEFYAVGDDQYDGTMRTGTTGLPSDTRISTNSLILRSYSEQARNDRSNVHFDLLGHSMGGLISRHYIQTYMPASPDENPVVRKLVMLGTPHEGSTLADIMFSVLSTSTETAGTEYPYNLLELTPGYLNRVFNPRITNKRDVEFSIAAGAPVAIELTSSYIVGLETPNDGIVPLSSAFALNTPSVSFRWSRIFDSNHIDQTHNGTIFNDFSHPILASVAPAAQAALAALPTQASAEPPLSEAPQTVIYDGTVSVGAGATVDVPINVPTSRAVGFILLDIPGLNSTVTAPDTTVISTESIAPGEWPGFVRMHLDEPASAGTYNVQFENTTIGPIVAGVAAVALATNIELEANLSVAPDGSLLVQAILPVAAPAPVSVTARIIGHDQSFTTLTLQDDGNAPDEVASDNVFAVSLPTLGAGVYEAMLEATLPDGTRRFAFSNISSLGEITLTQTPLPNGMIRFTWPTSAGPDAVLESNLGLTPPVWTPIETLPSINGDLYVIEIELIDDAEAFRLRLGSTVLDQVQLDTSLLRHTADTNQDSQIDLSELLRVIQLYNTRNGTTRTGRYRINSSAEDGVDSDPDTSLDSTPILSKFHAADTNRDAQLSLSELLRLIQLYNKRDGTVRTGRYRAQSGTVDGFTPDTIVP